MLDTGTTIALCEEGIPPPSEVLLQRYQYKPCPLETGELPMPDHLFFHLFYKPAGHSSSKWMNRLPKKIRESIFNDTAEVPVAWGIHILESTDYSVVFLILLVGMLVSGAFGVIWAWLRTDVQGGFTIGGYIVTVQAMWMAAMFSKWSRE